jgi:hypothetical protein
MWPRSLRTGRISTLCLGQSTIRFYIEIVQGIKCPIVTNVLGNKRRNDENPPACSSRQPLKVATRRRSSKGETRDETRVKKRTQERWPNWINFAY